MTGSYCSSCGAERAPGARFCASCGSAMAAPENGAPQNGAPQNGAPQNGAPTAQGSIAAPPQPAPPQYVTAQPPVPAAQHAPAQPSYPHTYPQPQPAVGSYPGGQVGYAYPAQQPWAGSTAYGAQPAPPAAAPWSAAPSGALATGAPGRGVVDALLTGNWAGAAKTAAAAVGVMTAISLVGVLLLTQGGVGLQETVALVFAGVTLAVGGDAFAEADVESFGSSFSIGFLPLTVTLVGLGVLGWFFARQLRTSRPATATDPLLHGVRTALVFTAFFLPLSLLTRYTAEQADVLWLTGSLGVGVFTSVTGAFLFAVAALGLTWLFHPSVPMPARVTAFRDKARAPLFGALAVFSVGLLAVVAGLVYGLVEQGSAMVQIGTTILVAGNAALSSVLLSAGVPLNIEGNASSSVLGEFTPSGRQSVDLFTLTDLSGWFWLAPVLFLVTLVLVATALAVRQNTVEDARREGLRFAAALAVVAFLATLLLRIAVDGEAAGGEDFAFQADTAADASLMFNPLFAAVVLGVWGAATGLLAPVVGAKIGSGFVTGVRRRFGAAAQPAPPVG